MFHHYHYAVLKLLFVLSWREQLLVCLECFSIVALEKSYTNYLSQNQILIQDTVLNMYLDTRCKIHFCIKDTTLDISDTTQHCLHTETFQRCRPGKQGLGLQPRCPENKKSKVSVLKKVLGLRKQSLGLRQKS